MRQTVIAPTLFGRKNEWSSLLDRCARTRSGEGGIFWLQGEAGLGKTALMSQLRTWADDNDFTTLWGSHIDHAQAPPLHGLRAALAHYFCIVAGDGPEQIESKIGELLTARFPGLALHHRGLIHFLEPLTAATDTDLGQQSDFIYHPLYSLLAAIAADRPMLFFLDDCHWADASTFDCLSYLMPLIADHPLLLIASTRPDELSPQGNKVLHDRNATTLTLSRLDLDATRSMAQQAGMHNEATCQRLHTLTEGVPLFVEQWLVECQNPPDGGPPDQQLARRPESTTQIITRRLQRLSADQLDLAKIAAVTGDLFSADLLQAVDGRPLEQILALLTSLEQYEYILRRPLSAEPHVFSFHHTLLRQVLYDTTPSVQRQQLHQKVAEYLQTLLPAQPDLVFEIGHHYIAAHRRDQAAEVLFMAGQRAQALYALAEAQAYFAEALQAADGPQAIGLRSDIREALGFVIHNRGDREGARVHFEAALAEQTDPLRRAMLYINLANTWKASDLHKYWHLLQQGLKETDDHPQSSQRAHVLALLMHSINPHAERREDNIKQKARYAAAFLRIARRLPDGLLLARFYSSYVFLIVDRPGANFARRRRQIARGLRWSKEQGHWTTTISCHIQLANTWIGTDIEKAIEEGEKALTLTESVLPPGHLQSHELHRLLLQWSWGTGDHSRITTYQQRLDAFLEAYPNEPLTPMSGAIRGPQADLHASFDWQQQPDRAWACLERVARFVCHHQLIEIRLVKVISRLLRLALEQNRAADYQALVNSLQREFPTYFSTLSLRHWSLPAVDAPAEPVGNALSCDEFAWHDETRCNRHQRLDDDVVELESAPGVGLAWGISAPCLLHEAQGDFTLQTRIHPESPLRRAGGLVVWNDRHWFIRFASGVDHQGQVSFGWHDGTQLRYAGFGYHPANALYLRLVRRGHRYESFVSPDGKTWQSCGQLRFGDDSAVQVGLFAESNYEHDFYQPFPIRFTETQLWLKENTAKSPTSTGSAHSSLYPLPTPPEPFCGMIGQGRAFAQFRRQLEEVAGSALPLLIQGETGTGKELAAQGVHQLGSNKNGPYIPINVAALPHELIESELFGHKKGAFTGATRDHQGLFAAAAKGSIFLDEIGELPLDLQVRLLRVLDSGEIRALGSTSVHHVDTRIIAATNRDLAQAVASGAFRQDLYFRFADPLVIPPLRERREDIPHLVAFFLHLFGQGAAFGITREAMQRLEQHDWPDNIRGLRQIIERAVLTAELNCIETRDLNFRNPLTKQPPAEAEIAAPPAQRSSKRQIPPVEILQQSVDEHHGNIAALSRHFGVSRLTIYRWCERQGIDIDAARNN